MQICGTSINVPVYIDNSSDCGLCDMWPLRAASQAQSHVWAPTMHRMERICVVQKLADRQLLMTPRILLV